VSESAPRPGPGWYPDPGGSGSLRYFDGTAWTPHTAPPPPWYTQSPYGYNPWAAPPWKGAQLGRPGSGPGALANPGRRLAARLLDALVMLPVLAALLAIALSLVIPRAGPMFPKVGNNPDAPVPFPGVFWVELTVVGCIVATLIVMAVYETVMTARYGRSLGKAWLGIRPVRTRGGELGWGRAFARTSLPLVALLILNWVALLDGLWCLWDGNRQCVHDKIVDSIVINDPVVDGEPGAPPPPTGYGAGPSAPGWTAPGAPYTGNQ
jgi:uncharacterized RDD family membrane protein YckC